MKIMKKGFLIVSLLVIISILFLLINIVLSGFVSILLFLLLFIVMIGVSVYLFRSKRLSRSIKFFIALMILPVLLISFFFTLMNASISVLHVQATNYEITPTDKMSYLKTLVNDEVSTKRLVKKEEGQITFFYPSTQKEELITESVSVLNEKEEEFKEYFDLQEKEDLTIIYTPLGVTRTGNKFTIRKGYYDSGNRKIVVEFPRDDKGKTEWKEILTHEYVHYLLDTTANNYNRAIEHFPTWFVEGLAEHVARKDHDYNLNLYKNKVWKPFSELTYADDFQSESSVTSPHYFQSKVFIDTLVEQEGRDVIMEIIEETSKTSFEEAFINATGKTFHDFGDEVIKDIEQMVADHE